MKNSLKLFFRNGGWRKGGGGSEQISKKFRKTDVEVILSSRHIVTNWKKEQAKGRTGRALGKKDGHCVLGSSAGARLGNFTH